ncbi:hypothetical protein TWF481_002228 [Arthrobotrys musiformis]|uniref:Uncharacterized protein n=1 Tax=Arthrobotrys musiformis TaxID=47236 RepID=A0AAV9VUL0_9PEZI
MTPYSFFISLLVLTSARTTLALPLQDQNAISQFETCVKNGPTENEITKLSKALGGTPDLEAQLSEMADKGTDQRTIICYLVNVPEERLQSSVQMVEGLEDESPGGPAQLAPPADAEQVIEAAGGAKPPSEKIGLNTLPESPKLKARFAIPFGVRLSDEQMYEYLMELAFQDFLSQSDENE